jgi:hypothetical protein
MDIETSIFNWNNTLNDIGSFDFLLDNEIINTNEADCYATPTYDNNIANNDIDAFLNNINVIFFFLNLFSLE